MAVQPCGYCSGGYRYEFGILKSCSSCNGTGFVTTDDESRGGNGSGESDTLFPWVDQLFKLIPNWVHWFGAILTGIGGYSYGIHKGY